MKIHNFIATLFYDTLSLMCLQNLMKNLKQYEHEIQLKCYQRMHIKSNSLLRVSFDFYFISFHCGFCFCCRFLFIDRQHVCNLIDLISDKVILNMNLVNKNHRQHQRRILRQTIVFNKFYDSAATVEHHHQHHLHLPTFDFACKTHNNRHRLK